MLDVRLSPNRKEVENRNKESSSSFYSKQWPDDFYLWRRKERIDFWQGKTYIFSRNRF